MLETHKQIYAYTRTWENEIILILTNTSAKEAIFHLPKYVRYSSAALLLSNYDSKGEDIQQVLLQPYEARVYRLV